MRKKHHRLETGILPAGPVHALCCSALCNGTMAPKTPDNLAQVAVICRVNSNGNQTLQPSEVDARTGKRGQQRTDAALRFIRCQAEGKRAAYSTVTDLARLRGLSTSVPRTRAT